MWMRACLAIALAAATPAAARTTVHRDGGEPVPADTAPRVLVGTPGAGLALDKLRVVVTSDEVATTLRLAFTISTPSRERRQAVLPIALPEGARIVGGSVAIGTAERVEARALDPTTARVTYAREFAAAKDPLLVEIVDDERDHHAIPNDAIVANAPSAFVPAPPRLTTEPGITSYVVRAFPLTMTDPARIELVIELPDVERLAIAAQVALPWVEVATPVSGWRTLRDVRAPFAFAVPVRARPLAAAAQIAARPRVNLATSLYAGFAPSRGGPRVVMGGAPVHPHVHGDIEAREVRRAMKLNRERFTYCYERVTQYQGGPEGTAVLHFTILPSGEITEISVDGELDDPRITSCLAEVVGAWRFRAGEGTVMVNYPLTFQLPPHGSTR